MSYLRQIIDYFFHHTFAGELEKRVHQRLVQSGDEPEREEAFRSLWREADEAQMPQAAVDRSFQVLQEKLQLPLSASSRGPFPRLAQDGCQLCDTHLVAVRFGLSLS